MEDLTQEVIAKAMAFHDRIESSDYLTAVMLELDDCPQWHEFREVMIRYSILKPNAGIERPMKPQKGG